MSLRRVLAVALLQCVVLAACETRNGIVVAGAGGNGATVRLINATSSRLDLVVNGVAASGNRALPFGVSSSCTNVDVASGTVAVRVADSTTNLPFTPTLAAGGRYLVLAYPDAEGAIQLSTVTQDSNLVSIRSELAVFEGVPSTVTGNYDVYITAPAAALTTPDFRNLSFGFGTPFFDVPPRATQVRLTNAGTQNVVIDAGSFTLAANTVHLLAVVLPTPFLATGC
jgi:hypothetical protein